MTVCSALHCGNSSNKGFLMKRFPRDSARRKRWLLETKRENWTPTDHSYLCELHFAPEMWEKIREDGSRRLKPNAIPTIFSFPEAQDIRIPPLQTPILSLKRIKCCMCKAVGTIQMVSGPETTSSDKTGSKAATSTEDAVVSQPVCLKSKSSNDTVSPTLLENVKTVKSLQDKLDKYEKISQPVSLKSESSNDTVSPTLLENMKTVKSLQDKLNKYEKMYMRERNRAERFKKALRSARNALKNHKKKSQVPNKLMMSVFNRDQLMALEKRQRQKTTKLMKWTNETITKSLKLKFSCGKSGYEELLEQGFPLPSLRTLQRRPENLKFNSGILHEVFNVLEIIA